MFQHISRRLAYAAAVLLIATACDKGAGTVKPKEEPKQDAVKTLTRIGIGTFEAHPGEKIKLQALLSLSEVGGVDGEDVKWQITEDSGGCELAQETVKTAPQITQIEIPDPNDETKTITQDISNKGVSENELTLAGQGTVTVKATNAGAVNKAIWRIDVVPLVKKLEGISGTGVSMGIGGKTADVTVGVNGQVAVRILVYADAQFGKQAIPDENVTFSMVSTLNGVKFESGTNGVLKTGADGEISMTVAAGTTLGSFSFIATISNGERIVYTGSVSNTASSACNFSSDCPPNNVCDNGTCKPQTGGQSCDGSEQPCPLGYECVGKVCVPASGTGCVTNADCPTGLICVDGLCVPLEPECGVDDPCPSGFDCINGICKPADGTLDVSGSWYKKDMIDIRAALPSWIKFSAAGIRTVDQIFLGQLNLPTGFGWVNNIIRGLVKQFIPEWVVTVVYVLDSIGTIFSNLIAEGEMELTTNGSPSILAAQEYWSTFVFYLLPQCGQNIGGVPAYAPPPCARVDIYTADLNQASIATEVKPYGVKVGKSAAGVYTLVFDKHGVNMNFAGILKVALDKMISLVTNGQYESLEGPPGHPEEGALGGLIDCASVAEQVYGIAGLLQGLVDIEALCKQGVAKAGEAVSNQLRNLVLTNKDTLELEGTATARDTNNDQKADFLGFPDNNFIITGVPGNWPANLGANPTFQRNPADGTETGTFKLFGGKIVPNMPGRWAAQRTEFPQQ